jgi:hypothetical protein
MNHLTLSRRDFLWRTSVAAVFSSVWIEPAWASNTDYVIAETSFGKVRGIESRGIKVFKGIPYGGNTGGSNRFMPSVDPASWIGIRDALNLATALRKACLPFPEKITPPHGRTWLLHRENQPHQRLFPLHPFSEPWRFPETIPSRPSSRPGPNSMRRIAPTWFSTMKVSSSMTRCTSSVSPCSRL